MKDIKNIVQNTRGRICSVTLSNKHRKQLCAAKLLAATSKSVLVYNVNTECATWHRHSTLEKVSCGSTTW